MEPETPSLLPKYPIKYPLSRDVLLPCHGKWDLFDQDVVTDEHKELCASCPAFEWCFTWALMNEEDHIWAGTDKAQRAALRSQQLRKGAA